MNLKDFRDLVDPEDQKLIGGVVAVLDKLRHMDAERIHFLLTQVRMSKGIFPKELLPGIEALEADFTLILVFIEEAMQYDRSEDAFKSSDWLYGKEVQPK